MAAVISMDEALGKIQNGMTIMVSGFMGCGAPHGLIDRLSRCGVKNLTLIVNDASMHRGPDGSEYYGVAKLVHAGQVAKLVTSHAGRNPEVSEQAEKGLLGVAFLPLGSMVEMIRAGGAGLGGVLTPTGLGTIAETSEYAARTIDVDGKKYLLMRPLRADVALLSGYRVDRAGNVWYKGTARNLAPVMATAADVVIVEADHLVEVGAIDPENVVTPGILVDYIVEGGSAP